MVIRRINIGEIRWFSVPDKKELVAFRVTSVGDIILRLESVCSKYVATIPVEDWFDV